MTQATCARIAADQKAKDVISLEVARNYAWCMNRASDPVGSSYHLYWSRVETFTEKQLEEYGWNQMRPSEEKKFREENRKGTADIKAAMEKLRRDYIKSQGGSDTDE
jgi:hypothetical protein